MAPATAVESARTPNPAVVERARRLFADADRQETQLDRGQYSVALRAALAYVEEHRRALESIAEEVAGRLDETALAFYRLSETDLAARALETRPGLAPGSPPPPPPNALHLPPPNPLRPHTP